MANVITLNVYQINDDPVRQGTTLYVPIDFPAELIFARETTIIVSGTQMNSYVVFGDNKYYVVETTTEIATAANAGGTLDIDGLPAAAALDGTEEVPVFQGSANAKTTTQDIANLGGGSSYLVYTALLSQRGTNAPTELAVLQNTLGNNLTYIYDFEGGYQASISGTFNSSKTWVIIGNNASALNTMAAFIGVNGNLYIETTNGTGTFTYANDVLNKTPIEIRVYP